jgi:hypothetical protein
MATRASDTTRMIESATAGAGASLAPRPRVGKQDRHFVTALSRGLDVLSCFRSGSRLLGNQDISERCRLPKSTGSAQRRSRSAAPCSGASKSVISRGR